LNFFKNTVSYTTFIPNAVYEHIPAGERNVGRPRKIWGGGASHMKTKQVWMACKLWLMTRAKKQQFIVFHWRHVLQKYKWTTCVQADIRKITFYITISKWHCITTKHGNKHTLSIFSCVWRNMKVQYVFIKNNVTPVRTFYNQDFTIHVPLKI
jgi:hypothetical protein